MLGLTSSAVLAGVQTAAGAAAPASTAVTGRDQTIVIAIAVIAALGLVMAFVFRRQVLAAGEGTERMQEIAAGVQEGASAYLRRQFRTLAVFALPVVALLFVLPGDWEVRVGRAVLFLVGALFSAAVGYLGMSLAVRANVRVAAAARTPEGRAEGFRLAIRTGGTVGMATVGLGLLGASLVVLFFKSDAPTMLEGFGFGAALVAMFMRVGGGIFTKAADVGADLVGKVEQGIPEDDPRNAATIADNVGDNVGDCAGMAADLFESYAVTLVAALILGRAAFGDSGLVFPLLVPAVGAITAVLGIMLIRARGSESGLGAIQRGFYLSAVVSAVGSTAVAFAYLPSSFSGLTGLTQAAAQVDSDPRFLASAAVIVGILLAVVILWITGYYTGTESKPTQAVARTSLTGPATVVLSGIGLGLTSAVYTTLIIGGAVLLCFLLAAGSTTLALFLVALAGTGLLTTVGVIVAMDTFGPVSDNAQGIAEMSGDVDEEAARTLTDLDAVGNTTKAITKGIAIATAVLAATALFGSLTDTFLTAAQSAFASVQEVPSQFVLQSLGLQLNQGGFVIAIGQVTVPSVLVGLLAGSAVVFLFSGLAIDAVTRAAGAIVFEVRRQFREKPGIMDGTEKPEYGRVVDICTRDSLRELATPGLLAVLAPVVVGFGLGVASLAGFLAGAIGTGALMAVFLSNAGGAWDNAKKLVEDGRYGGKGSEAHAATVIGDTVGDPFKDTAGPAINPLLKVMNLVAILIVPAVVALTVGESASTPIRLGIAAVALLVLVVAVYLSARRTSALDADEDDDDLDDDLDDDGDGSAQDSPSDVDRPARAVEGAPAAVGLTKPAAGAAGGAAPQREPESEPSR
ncbi:sodium-translocating pyrophosphatase [Quadrisphaera setariae]|uniref:K(+)-insensitive pyrophosphate-energized proton pump n=1 Tax=Quadrisphaera setariae TaxID=2593304 RepID=A0A5C8Z5X6_9ACTN|nr:sodium-translocating pyrophosphatase [Quadrisphaera setariae]TXR52330.1 sodium-translocating pyrophosphatase [Quadrisphaera setariae]